MDAEKVEKVCKGLKCCENYIYKDHDNCPYESTCYHNGLSKALISDALSVIRGLQAEIPKWIPVDERLPDDYEKVLIFDEKWGILPGWHARHGWNTSEVKTVTEITHWIPKPEPPKEGES